jgi:predicted RNase H-like HicB family nuclease
MVVKVKPEVKLLKFRVSIINEPDDQHFYAHSPALPGLQVGGDTETEALQNARDGAIGLLHSMIMDGDPIPLSIMIMKKKEVGKLAENDKRLYHEEVMVNIA